MAWDSVENSLSQKWPEGKVGCTSEGCHTDQFLDSESLEYQQLKPIKKRGGKSMW